MPRDTTRRRPAMRKQEEPIDGETVWVKVADSRGIDHYVQTKVLSWGTLADGQNAGRPLVHIPGGFAFYARIWRRASPNTCACRVCAEAKRRGRPPVHGITGND